MLCAKIDEWSSTEKAQRALSTKHYIVHVNFAPCCLDTDYASRETSFMVREAQGKSS